MAYAAAGMGGKELDINNASVRIAISVLGRFHAFYLARELDRHGCLDCLITSYPAWATEQWGVRKELVRSLWPVEVGRRILPEPIARWLQDRGTIRDAYDLLAARRLPPDPDLVVAWSGSAEKTLRRAGEMGATAIVERGSCHIRTQREILKEEYRRHGLEPDIPSETVVEKEETEYRVADRIVVPSKFVERSFLAQGTKQEKLIRVPYGVNPEEFEPVEKDDSTFRVVFAGALSVRKGIYYLLRAFYELNLSDAELLLLGAARDESNVWLSRYGRNVRHPGHVPQEELDHWYSQGSVFVLPSVEEGMACVQLQAMACRLPLICTPNTGGGDLIRDGKEGFIVPIREVEALKERIYWCYRHRNELRGMGRAARRRVLEQYTWQDYGNRIVSAYRDNIRSRDSSSD